MHRLLLHNDQTVDAAAHIVSPGQVGLLNGWGVFSTLRVYDGVLFCWDRHWKRMKFDAERMRVPFPAESQWLEDRLLKLVEANQAWNSTLRVVYHPQSRRHVGRSVGYRVLSIWWLSPPK